MGMLERAIASMSSRITDKTGLASCTRCGSQHDEMEWAHLSNPSVDAPDGATPSAIVGYAMCPVTNQPVFIQAWDMGD